MSGQKTVSDSQVDWYNNLCVVNICEFMMKLQCYLFLYCRPQLALEYAGKVIVSIYMPNTVFVSSL